MAYTPADYTAVMERIRDWYGVSSSAVWDVINTYDLSPAQLYDVVPKAHYGRGADGLYHVFSEDGSALGLYQEASVPLSTGNLAESAINSNAQTGTAAVTEKVRFAGNSVIDGSGKIKTSPGVTKYVNGTSVGKVLGVIGSVASGTAAAATGISLGKKFDSALYNANPAFWDSIGASTLNPETWKSIVMDMGDTGVEGALKTAFNFILGLNDDGSTQTYMPADAYNYMAYVLAQSGMFNTAEQWAEPLTGQGSYQSYYDDLPSRIYIQEVTNNVPYMMSLAQSGSQRYVGWGMITGATAPVYCIAIYDTSGHVSIGTCSKQSYRRNSASALEGQTPTFSGSGALTNVTSKLGLNSASSFSSVTASDYIEIYAPHTNTDFATISTSHIQAIINTVLYGTHDESSTIEGISTQTGATSPTGISSTSTPQQITDAIAQQYPNLYNNRVEQEVVNEDGTTKTLIYYPVPLPNRVADTTIAEPTTITPDTPVSVIIPEGQTITLPSGDTVTGDGTTPVTLPSGTYVLPTNTVVTNNYYVSEDDPDGGTQANPTVTDSSTDTLLQTIINILTNPLPQTATDSSTVTPSDTPNPTDTGDGTTPVIVVPVGSASALWAVYNPTQAELNQFGGWLWSNNFVDQLLKMFNDPMQAIIGLHKTFIPPITGSAQNIIVGYLNSGVSSLTVPTQYSSVDCGTVDCSEYFGNVFDYAPYTKVYIYLPFIGFRELDVAQVMRSRINVKYHGDAFTGACLAEVSVIRDAGAGGVLYTFSGDCAARYPLSHGSYMGIANAIAGLALGIGGALTGAPVMGAMGALSMAQHARATVEHSGGFSGNSGAMGIKKPYLVIMRPQPAMAPNYEHFTGNPSNDNIVLGSATGYVRVKEVHVENIPSATDSEKSMIENILKQGVIV